MQESLLNVAGRIIEVAGFLGSHWLCDNISVFNPPEATFLISYLLSCFIVITEHLLPITCHFRVVLTHVTDANVAQTPLKQEEAVSGLWTHLSLWQAGLPFSGLVAWFLHGGWASPCLCCLVTVRSGLWFMQIGRQGLVGQLRYVVRPALGQCTKTSQQKPLPIRMNE